MKADVFSMGRQKNCSDLAGTAASHHLSIYQDHDDWGSAMLRLLWAFRKSNIHLQSMFLWVPYNFVSCD